MSFDAFAAAGLYDPQAPNAEERRQYLQSLLDRGFTVDQITSVNLMRQPVTDLLALLNGPPIRHLSAREVAERANATVDEVMELREVLNMPVASPDSVEIAETFVDDFALQQFAVAMFGRDRVLGFARMLGGTLAALMEASREMAWAPLRDVALTELEVAEANEAAMAAFRLLPDMIAHLLMERASRDVSFELQLMRGPVQMAVGFVDLIGSTEWASSVTAEDHAAGLNHFEDLAVRIAGKHAARVVKFIGDEAMLVGADPAFVTNAAAELCATITEDPSLPDARAAVGWGALTPRGGDYFGEIVNLVARATKKSAAGGVVVTKAVAARLDPAQCRIGPARSVELRGLREAVELVDVAF